MNCRTKKLLYPELVDSPLIPGLNHFKWSHLRKGKVVKLSENMYFGEKTKLCLVNILCKNKKEDEIHLSLEFNISSSSTSKSAVMKASSQDIIKCLIPFIRFYVTGNQSKKQYLMNNVLKMCSLSPCWLF